MNTMTEYENTQKRIMAAIRKLNRASKASNALDEKIKFQLALKGFQKIQETLRLNLFLYEDAIELAKTTGTCSECFAITTN